MPIDADEVRRIAGLARLALDEADVELLRHQLQSVLDHVARLDELEAQAVPPPALGTEPGQPLRDDQERPSLSLDEALGHAPDHASEHFRVPRVLGG